MYGEEGLRSDLNNFVSPYFSLTSALTSLSLPVLSSLSRPLISTPSWQGQRKERGYLTDSL